MKKPDKRLLKIIASKIKDELIFCDSSEVNSFEILLASGYPEDKVEEAFEYLHDNPKVASIYGITAETAFYPSQNIRAKLKFIVKQQ